MDLLQVFQGQKVLVYVMGIARSQVAASVLGAHA